MEERPRYNKAQDLRSWTVRSNEEPLGNSLQHTLGLAVINRITGDTKPKNNLEDRPPPLVWERPEGKRAPVKWPSAWTEKGDEQAAEIAPTQVDDAQMGGVDHPPPPSQQQEQQPHQTPVPNGRPPQNPPPNSGQQLDQILAALTKLTVQSENLNNRIASLEEAKTFQERLETFAQDPGQAAKFARVETAAGSMEG